MVIHTDIHKYFYNVLKKLHYFVKKENKQRSLKDLGANETIN